MCQHCHLAMFVAAVSALWLEDFAQGRCTAASRPWHIDCKGSPMQQAHISKAAGLMLLMYIGG